MRFDTHQNSGGIQNEKNSCPCSGTYRHLSVAFCLQQRKLLIFKLLQKEYEFNKL